MVLFPPGEVLLWDFFRGEGLPYGIPSWGAIWYQCGGGGGLPYDIPSWGTFAIWYHFRGAICHGICSLIMKFVCGGDLP